jgi:hypothetical protein
MEKTFAKPKLVPIAPLPQVLHGQRDRLRKMMAGRCALPDSPIPPKLANRIADWILMMVSYRANERRKAGGKPWENQEVLQEDIARSAEMIELVFIAAKEEAVPPPDLLVARTAMNDS